MLMLFFASVIADVQDKGLLGVLGVFASVCIGAVGWMDKRIRDVDGRVRDVTVDTAGNTATIVQMDKKIDRLLDIAENGHARD